MNLKRWFPHVAPNGLWESGWRDPAALLLALSLVVLNYLDAAFTVKLMGAGYIEGNPVWSGLMAAFGTHALVFPKMLGIVAATAAILVTRRNCARGALLFLVGFYLNLVIGQALALYHLDILW